MDTCTSIKIFTCYNIATVLCI